MRAPCVVATVVGVRLECAAEVGHGEGRDLAGDIQFNGRVIEGCECGRDFSQQSALQRELIGVRVEVTETGEEDLPLDAESGADLNDLGDLLKLRGETVVCREDGLQWRDGLHGVGERLGIGVGIGGDGVVACTRETPVSSVSSACAEACGRRIRTFGQLAARHCRVRLIPGR